MVPINQLKNIISLHVLRSTTFRHFPSFVPLLTNSNNLRVKSSLDILTELGTIIKRVKLTNTKVRHLQVQYFKLQNRASIFPVRTYNPQSCFLLSLGFLYLEIMGNSHKTSQSSQELDPNKVDISYSRFLPQRSQFIDHSKKDSKIRIAQFKKLQDWQQQLQGANPNQKLDNTLISYTYFRQQKDMNNYLQSLYSLKQLCDVSVFDDIEVKFQNSLYAVVTKQLLPSNAQQPILKKNIVEDINKCLDFLIFICRFISKAENLYITPEEIVQCEGHFYLKGFQHKQYQKNNLLLGYIAWLHQENQDFTGDIPTEHLISFNDSDIYMREIFFTLKNGKIRDQDLVHYLQKVKQKIKYLNGNFDSFHACFKAKRAKNCSNNAFKQWILAKRNNEIYFYNIMDMHLSQGKIIRKQRKINMENVHLLFNAQQFQVSFMLEGTKNMVKTSQFQLQDTFTISDIEIKHKFPFKIKNPMMFQKGRQIYLYDQLIYRYNVDQNKLYQESKKISDCLCLIPCHQLNYLVVRLSIDIFRHGIRIYIEDKYQILYPSGNSALSSDIQNLKIDITSVQFCIQVYKKIFLIKANKNLWILDLNFMCFFSYCPIQRIKEYYKQKNHNTDQQIFEVLNQPFPVTWLSHQDGQNVSIKQDSMFMIGNVMGKLFFLEYKFIFEAGLLKLHRYCPLFNKQNEVKQISSIGSQQVSQFNFNVYSQNMQILRSNHWIYRGFNFLEISNLRTIWNKNCIEVVIETKKVLLNLKELIEENRRCHKKWDIYQTGMLLYKVLEMFTQITKMSISHKHFSINNIWITKKKQIKLKGWSQPSRNWFISDYRDFLLVCFNIVTLNVAQKLTDKLVEKHESDLSAFPGLKQRISFSLRNKAAQKKFQLDKYLETIRCDFSKAIFPLFQIQRNNNFIVSVQSNTPRFSLLSISQSKIKKMVAVAEENNHAGNHSEEFTFKSTDSYVWNEEESKFYIFTANYQMFELTINGSDFKDETVILEEYEYLPQNITECSFIYTEKGLFAFGGIARHSKNKTLYNQHVYHFDKTKLTWTSVAEIGQAKLKPQLILSQTKRKVYLMGGELDCGRQNLEVIQFDTTNNTVKKFTDFGCINPLLHLCSKITFKLFNISERYSIFMLWSVTSNLYSIKIFSNLIGGMEIDFEGKIYLEDTSQIPSVSITAMQGCIHFLRPYGKYTKISLNQLNNLTVSNKILYSN